MRHNSTSFSSSARQSSSVLVSLAVWALSAFFVASGSNAFASQTVQRFGLYDSKAGRYVSYVYKPSNYQWSTHDGTVSLWPFLGSYNYSNFNYQYFEFWPKSYSKETSPVLYHPARVSTISINDGYDINEFCDAINSAFPTFADQLSIQSVSVSYVDGKAIPNVTTKPVGTRVNDGVVSYDESGHLSVHYPDSSGYIPGYVPTDQSGGGFRPVWYDISGSSVLTLDSLSNTSSSDLRFDESTGLYSFTIPDYSAQLSAIHDTIQNKRFTIDNIELPSPEVTVNVSPPEVNVPAPEVTVNVSPPEVNVPAPEVTVNVSPPEVNVPAPEVTVNVDNDYSDVVSSLDQIVEASYSFAPTNDFSQETFTDEEQGLINTAKGWETNIPVLGEAFDLGLDILIGKIPQMNKTYQLLNMKLMGYDVVCDLEPYKDTIMIFRAFFLLCELIWFFWVLWHDIMNALKV